MKKVFNKLVRDKIPEIILKNGCTPEIEILDNQEYLHHLDEKLMEECNEVICAKNAKDKAEELADVLEVMYATAISFKIPFEEIEKVRLDKKEKRGGFDSKIFLKSTTIVKNLE